MIKTPSLEQQYSQNSHSNNHSLSLTSEQTYPSPNEVTHQTNNNLVNIENPFPENQSQNVLVPKNTNINK